VSKHTPLPWETDAEVVYTTVGEKETVADCWEDDDAEFIVLACNSFDDLLAACKAGIKSIENRQSHAAGVSTEWSGDDDPALQQLRNAIAKAEGKTDA